MINPARGGLLNLEFTKSPLDPRITFTRASNATYFDGDGVLQTAGNGVARIKAHTFDGTNWINRGLLIEEARTNISLQSEDFSTTWAASNITVTTNDRVAPDGNTTADKLTNATGNTEIFTPSAGKLVISAGDTVTASAFFRYIDNPWVRFYVIGASGNGFAWFNIQTGVKGSTTESVYTVDNYDIIDVGGGWYRVWLTVTTSTDTGIQVSITASLADGSSVETSGNSIHAWGVQVEVGAFLTSYIPTTTASVTRAADVATMSDVSWLDETQGTWFIRATHTQTAQNGEILIIDDNSTVDRVIFRNNLGKPAVIIRAAASNSVSDTSGTLTVNTEQDVAFAYGSNDYAKSVDGAAVATDSTVTLPTGLLTLRIGADNSSANIANAYIARITYWNRRLENALLQELTS